MRIEARGASERRPTPKQLAFIGRLLFSSSDKQGFHDALHRMIDFPFNAQDASDMIDALLAGKRYREEQRKLAREQAAADSAQLGIGINQGV